MKGLYRVIEVSAALAVISLLASPAALAQRAEPWPTWRDPGGYTYYKEYRSAKPQRGYSGFAGSPLRQSYCDYRRIPNRECHGGSCRVTSWTLQQYCY